MPKKGVKERQWEKEDMKKAIEAVRREDMGVLLASKKFGVPATTLRRMARSNKSIEELLFMPLGRRTVFSKDIEDDLVKYLLEMKKDILVTHVVMHAQWLFSWLKETI